MKQKTRGFTFIELLVVLVIVGITLSASLFGLSGVRENSRNTARLADIEQLKSGLSRFFADCFSYPTEAEFLAAQASGELVGIPSKAPGCLSTNVYIEKFPLDPESPGVTYSYTLVDDDNYLLCASISDSSDPTPAGCGSCGNRSCTMSVTN